MSVHVVGVGSTAFGRFEEASVRTLTTRAVAEALADASCPVGAVEAAFFANATGGALDGQHCVAGEIALESAGLHGVPVVNVENACASGATALHMAYAYVEAGLAGVVLVAGVEKMTASSRSDLFGWLRGSTDVRLFDDPSFTPGDLGALAAPAGVTEAPAATKSVFMDVYAGFARAHMKEFGTTQEQIAAVAAKNHQHSTLNPRAHFRRPFTVDEVLAAQTVTWPLTVPMCAPVSDGAAAVLVCSDEALVRFDRHRAVAVLASVLASGGHRGSARDEHVQRRAARAAYEKAGVSPADVSVAEVHDATSIGELLETEHLGLVEMGSGGWAATRGETALGGRIPVNPSGGLISKGHPIGATGVGQVHEIVCQLRGEAGARQVAGARIGLAQNSGGLVCGEDAACGVTVLGRTGR
jgi:acetyl-CoA acetyltransferase